MRKGVFSSAFICVLFFVGCTDLKKDLPSPVTGAVTVHEISWLDTSSANFHGAYLKRRDWMLSNCTSCHSSTFTGGISKVSCYKCHWYPHPEGWDTTFSGFHTSTNFHGTYLRVNNWQLDNCQTCHGTSFAGGSRVDVSCTTSGCHMDRSGTPKTPLACNTCHGDFRAAANDTLSWAPPRSVLGDSARTLRGVGAHQAHLLNGSISSTIKCTECHTIPSSVFALGHLDSQLPAEVMFVGVIANTTTNDPTTMDFSLELPHFVPSPSYDVDQRSCASVYCHGYFKNGNTSNAPIWNNTTGTQAACGTCHGDTSKVVLAERALPKTSSQGGTHPNSTACYVCHAGVVDANLNIIDKSKHINGKLNVFGEERDF